MIRAAIVLSLAACAAPAPHYHFVMPVASTAPVPAPGEPTVAVVGQVVRPGPIRFHVGLTVVGAIIDGGGFTQLARRRAIRIDRGTARFIVSLQSILDGLAPDLALRPGDRVFVPESDF